MSRSAQDLERLNTQYADIMALAASRRCPQVGMVSNSANTPSMSRKHFGTCQRL
jgi:hypothetical protein